MKTLKWLCAVAAVLAMSFAVYAAYDMNTAASLAAIGAAGIFSILFVMAWRAYSEMEFVQSELYQRHVERFLKLDTPSRIVALLALPSAQRKIILRSLRDHGCDTSFSQPGRQTRKLVKQLGNLGRLDLVHLLCTLSPDEQLVILYLLPRAMGYRDTISQDMAVILKGMFYTVDNIREDIQNVFGDQIPDHDVLWDIFDDFKNKQMRQDPDANKPMKECRIRE